MDVKLPETGCNILNSSTSFYNYSPDNRTRETYIIYDGQPKLVAETYNQYGYTYTGTCLKTGDITYRPELKVWFPIISVILFFAICKIAFRLLRGRL